MNIREKRCLFSGSQKTMFFAKRGQIALFVIIGVLLISAILLVYFLRPEILGISLSPEEAQKLITSQVQPVRDYTDDCMLLAARKTLNTMGRQGGYVIPRTGHFDIPATMADAPIMNYALFYDKERGYVNELPSLNAMKDELATYLEANLDFVTCIDEYSSFKKIINVDMQKNVPKIDRENLDIGESSGAIIIPYSFPVALSKGNASTYISDYELVIPINLARIRETSTRVASSIAAGRDYTEVIQEEGALEWEQARQNSGAEKLIMSAEAYTQPLTDQAGVRYDEKNLLFRINYQNPDLANPYDFYFLVGRA